MLGVAVACAPMLSYAHGFDGGHGGGGGGGGHSSGAHFGGGGHSGGAHAASGHAMARSSGGARYAAPHFSGGYAAHSFQGTRTFQPSHTAFTGRTGFAGAHGYVGAHGGWGGGGHYWGGGYWGGRFWPHAYFYPGYAWFLPLLPLGYATFWWGGSPYYYANNLYYTWDPGYNGYVVTDPPPVAGTDAAADGSADGAQPGNDAPQYSGPAPSAGSTDVYVYPRNGQNEQQTSNDRYECHSWAVNQTGFDPTRAAQQSGTVTDYQRAMIACLDARGYTAR
jgi:hypothetical protein